MTIENTKDRDPMLHLLGMLGGGSDSYITGMESDGQRQLVASSTLPTKAPWDDLIALGFTRGDPVSGDPIFTDATLPEGWSKEGSDHAMWSYIVDERGIKRVGVFYKAAFYDRSAHANLENVGYSLASSLMYGDEPVALPTEWDVLTDAERREFGRALIADVAHDKAMKDKYPDLDKDGRYSARIKRGTEALALIPRL